MAFCPGCYFEEGATEALYIPLSQVSVCSHQNHGKNSFLALYSQQENGSWTSWWFLVTVQTIDIYSPASARAMDLSVVSDGSTDQEHQYGFRWQQRPRTFTWPSVVTWARNINTAHDCSRTMDPSMALNNSMDHALSIKFWLNLLLIQVDHPPYEQEIMFYSVCSWDQSSVMSPSTNINYQG